MKDSLDEKDFELIIKALNIYIERLFPSSKTRKRIDGIIEYLSQFIAPTKENEVN